MAEDGLRFSWYAPTHGDGTFIGENDRAGSPDYIVAVARAAEAAGFDSILTPVGPGCADTLVAATLIACHTSRIRPIVALRPGFIAPPVAARALATLDAISGGRVSVNLVAGGSPRELAMDGDFASHDARYDRAREFTEVLIGAWTQSPYDFEGTYYRVRGSEARVPTVQRPHPVLYVGGCSEGAIELAARHVDAYLMWGEPHDAVALQIDQVRARAAAHGRTLRYGLRVNLIVEDDADTAWATAERMVSRASADLERKMDAYFRDADSVALGRIQSLRGATTGDPCFWTGMSRYRSGNSTALVGSPEQVAASLAAYVRAGVTEFIFSAYPHLETASYIGARVVPLVRALADAARRDATEDVARAG